MEYRYVIACASHQHLHCLAADAAVLTHPLKLPSKQQQVEPYKWLLPARIKFFTPILHHQSPELFHRIALLRSIVLAFSDKAKLEPYPVFRRSRDFARLSAELKPADELVQCVLELIDVGVVPDVRVEVVVQLILLRFWQPTIRGGEVSLECAWERVVVTPQGSLMRGEQVQRLGKVAAAEEEVDLGPEVDPVDGLGRSAGKLDADLR